MNQFNWDQAFTLDFDLNNGLSKHADTTERYLSQMKNMYQDQDRKGTRLNSSHTLASRMPSSA